MEQKITKIQEQIQLELDKSRYEHTQGVMYTAAALAMRYGEDINKAMLAGLLHDCAKCIPAEEKLRMCEENHLQISDVERANPSLLHAKLGAFLAKTKYKIEDYDILKAIDIDIVELTEFDDTFIRRIVEQVTILSKDKIEVRFIGGFSKVGDIPTK